MSFPPEKSEPQIKFIPHNPRSSLKKAEESAKMDDKKEVLNYHHEHNIMHPTLIPLLRPTNSCFEPLAVPVSHQVTAPQGFHSFYAPKQQTPCQHKSQEVKS